MNNLLEKDLRCWLKTAWSKGKGGIGIQWVEPTAGSSIGFPDALIPIWPVLIPMELKLSKKNKIGNYISIVRPVQKRFHSLMASNNMFSCFLIAYGNKNDFEVWLSHGSKCVWDENKNPGEVLIATKQTSNATISRMQFVSEVLKMMNDHNQVIIQVPGRMQQE